MPGTAWAVNGYLPDSSRGGLATPVLMPSDFISTRQRQGASAHRSSSRTSPDAVEPRLFPRRSPQRSSANAARGGLEPLPAERLWRANKPPSPYSTALNEVPSLLSTSRVRVHNKTLKYCPAFPGRFGSIEDARAFCAVFFDHYNHVHRHSGIGPAHPGIGPLRHRHRDPRPACRHPRRRLRRQPRPIPAPPPTPPSCPPSPGSTNPPPKHSSNPHKKLSHRP